MGVKQHGDGNGRRARPAMGRVRRVHFVGIGGVGMSGIAEVLLNLGYEVSGSDLREGPAVTRLRAAGARIGIGHRAEHITGADVVVVSSAVGADNPEVAAARAARLPVIPRAQMLAELMRFRQGIAVAGSHGKTTTTSLIASLLAAGGLDPTYVIGGRVNHLPGHGCLGEGDYLVAEADESDGSFLLLNPVMAVVTNIDNDHLGAWGGDFERLKDGFVDFVQRLPFYGLVVACADDAVLRALFGRFGRPLLTYGIEWPAEVRAVDLASAGGRSRFTAVFADGLRLPVELNLPGRHNVLNALAALAVAHELGVAPEAMQQALAGFAGIGRRFQRLGSLPLPGGAVELVDDYAHHPRELRATLAAARETWPDRRLVVLFQPHRYSRTRDLLDDFAAELCAADVLLLSEVYPAGERPLPGADGRALSQAVRARGKVDPVFVAELNEAPAVLRDLLRPGDVLLTLGAGSIGAFAAALPARWAEEGGA